MTGAGAQIADDQRIPFFSLCTQQLHDALPGDWSIVSLRSCFNAESRSLAMTLGMTGIQLHHLNFTIPHIPIDTTTKSVILFGPPGHAWTGLWRSVSSHPCAKESQIMPLSLSRDLVLKTGFR